MKILIACKVILILLLVSVFSFGFSKADAQVNTDRLPADKDGPPVFRGGLWVDEFYNSMQLSEAENAGADGSRLLLKTLEYLDWTQTWTTHFSSGEFFQTETLADSVRLAHDNTRFYFTTGVYTSTVFDAGKAVDWSAAVWNNSGSPSSVTIEFRTGNIAVPDDTWSLWRTPCGDNLFCLCAYAINGNDTYCTSIMGGMESSRYVQYRATFNSGDTSTTIELFDMRVSYGVHPLSGTATSEIVNPVDLLLWKKLSYTSTVPAGTSLRIDVLAPDGTVLVSNVNSEYDLSSINQSGLKLRAVFNTSDPSLSPELDLWELEWNAGSFLYFPIVFR
jgi:hypothetical protein